MDRSPFVCPRCQTPLTIFKARKVTLHVCPGCGGSWLAKGEDVLIPETYQKDALDIAEQTAQVAQAHVDVRQPIACPVCHGTMTARRVSYGDVIIDQCPEHGTWFDAHEMKQIADAAAQARRAKFQQSEQKAAPQPAPPKAKESFGAEVADEIAGDVAGVAAGVFFAFLESLFD